MTKVKIVTPRYDLVERVAGQMAAAFYEVGRSQGLQSVHKTPKAYAKANLEKFIPNAVSTLMEMLKPTSNCTPEMREEIYEALMERHNDPTLTSILPNIDVNKAIEIAENNMRNKVIEIRSKPNNRGCVLKDPGKATRH